MAIPVASNFSLKAKLPIDERILFNNIEEMKNYSEVFLPSVYFCVNAEDGNIYIFNSDNEVDEILGKWRIVQTDAPDTTFEYAQNVDSATWEIEHLLDAERPNVVCFDTDGNEIIGDITYIDKNNLKIDFCSELCGICRVCK